MHKRRGIAAFSQGAALAVAILVILISIVSGCVNPFGAGSQGDDPPPAEEDQPGTETVETPVISPAGGSFIAPVAVTLTCETVGAEILYSTDGSDPRTSGTRMTYTGTFELEQSAVVKACGSMSGMDTSPVAEASFTITIPESEDIAWPGDTYYWYEADFHHVVTTNTTMQEYNEAGDLIFDATILEFDNDAAYFVAVYEQDGSTVYSRSEWALPEPGVIVGTMYSEEATLQDARDSTTPLYEDWTLYADPYEVPPALALQGADPLPWPSEAPFTDPGALARDYETADQAVDATGLGGLDPGSPAPGSYTLTYSYADADGHTATPITRVVEVSRTVRADEVPDAALRAALETASVKTFAAPGAEPTLASITEADLSALEYLDLSALGIELISGLEFCTGLIEVDLTDNLDLLFPDGSDNLTVLTALQDGGVTVLLDEPMELLGTWYFLSGPPDGDPSQLRYLEMTLTNTSWVQTDGTETYPGLVEEFDNAANTAVVSGDATRMGGEGTFYQRVEWQYISPMLTVVTTYEMTDELETARVIASVQDVIDFHVGEENVPPVIVLSGDAELAIAEGVPFADPGAVALDWGVANESVDASDLGGMDPDTPASGVYTLTYTHSDADGNAAAPVERTVVVGGGTINVTIE